MEMLDRQITEHRASEFAIVILDVNDLKKVNDTQGHKAGDQYLRDACNIICFLINQIQMFCPWWVNQSCIPHRTEP